jgi:ABC-type uncharacterized transport system substrate-binding protein
MSGRVFVLALCAMLFALYGSVDAQPKKIPRIGYLTLSSSSPSPLQEAFRDGLRQLGYVEGQTIHIEYRYAAGKVEHLKELAAELVGLKPDIIVAANTQSIEASRQATKTIPIVFPLTFDPVASGFVTSLARPGGNLTGLTTLNQEVAGKRVELLKEILPKLSRVAIFRDPTNTGSRFALKETERKRRPINWAYVRRYWRSEMGMNLRGR